MEAQGGTGWKGARRVPGPTSPLQQGHPRHTAQDHIPLHDTAPHRGGKHVHALAPGTGGQTRLGRRCRRRQGGFYPRRRIGLSLHHGCRSWPSPAGGPHTPTRPGPARSTLPRPPQGPDPPALRPRRPRLRRPWAGAARAPEGLGPPAAASCPPSLTAAAGTGTEHGPRSACLGSALPSVPFPLLSTVFPSTPQSWDTGTVPVPALNRNKSKPC